MIKNLYWYIILALIALYFFYNYQNVNYVEGYRNAKVYVGESPMPRQGLLFMNNDDFAMNSIYEVGTIRMPHNNDYTGYYPGYYSNL
jgi:hypothetical protein